MERDRRAARTGRFRTRHVQIHDDRILSASDNDGFAGFIRPSVDLLMRDVGRDINKIPRPGFAGELEMVAPAHACPAAHNIEDGFKLAMMVRTGFRIGLDDNRAGPEFGGSGPSICDGGGAGHARSLGRVRIQVAGRDYFHAMVEPIVHHSHDTARL